MMFGPSDADSKHTAQSMRWKIKRFSNDELRQKFIDVTVPQAQFLGLTIPDPQLRWDEGAQHYLIGPIDWARVPRGAQGQRALQSRAPGGAARGPRGGAWVREAAAAHAAKERRRTSQAA